MERRGSVSRFINRLTRKEQRIPKTDKADTRTGSSQASEPRAGYYVASNSRPPFVTSMTSNEIAGVFDLVERVSKLPKSSSGSRRNDRNS